MNEYETNAYQELLAWKQKLKKRNSMFTRLSKKAQTKVNNYIPEKVHQLITDSIKNMVNVTLAGSEFIARNNNVGMRTLEEKEILLNEKLQMYKNTAAVEGAGTGVGGIFLGLADFPLLLSIKMKFLNDVALVYGFNTKEYNERLFLLYIFHLAFSSDEKRIEVVKILQDWDKNNTVDIDWRVLQQEYRDYLDLVKMMQMLPGVGAVVGAYVNYNLLDRLGEAAKFAYRQRLIGGKNS